MEIKILKINHTTPNQSPTNYPLDKGIQDSLGSLESILITVSKKKAGPPAQYLRGTLSGRFPAAIEPPPSSPASVKEGGTSISAEGAGETSENWKEADKSLSVDSIVLHRAKVFRPEDDDDDGDGGGCPAGRNRRQTAGRRGNAGLFHRRRRRHERFCHEKVGSPIKSKRGTTRAGDRSFRPLCRRRRASLAERGGGGEGPIPEATTSSRNLWREAGIGLLPRDADGLKNLLLARCK